MKPLKTPTFLSAPSAASLCGVTRNTVCTWIREEKLPAYRTAGGKNLIRPSELIRFMEEFQMFVPDSLRELSRKDGTEPAEAQSGEAAILVVEDMADARKLAVNCLKRLNMPVLEAETGYEALHILLTHPEVALVILDVMMPGQLGNETFREMRRQSMAMPVVVVTGHAPEKIDELFSGEGPDRVLCKPYRPAELLSVAQELMAAA